MPGSADLVSVGFGCAAVCLLVWAARRWPHAVDADRGLAPLACAALACLLAAFALFPETWLRGWVLSQAALLEDLWPWAARPPGVADGHWRNPLLGDAVWWGYPWMVAVTEAWRSARVPLWSAASYAGHPLAASYLPAAFSPFTAIAAIVPMPWATVAVAIARLAVGGAGMFVALRRMGLMVPAAGFGALACALNPFSLVWLEDPSASVVAFTPWLLAAAWMVITRGSRRDVAGLAVGVALVLLAGNPQTAFNVALLAAAFVVAGIVAGRERGHRAGTAARLVAGVALGLLLAAVQLVPFAEYARESRVLAARSAKAGNHTFVPRRAAVAAIVPAFFGNPAGASVTVANRFGEPTNDVEQVAYPGVVIWPLAAVGLAVSWRRWPVAGVAAAGVAGAALKYGAPGVLQLAGVVPLLRVTPLGRFGVVVILSAIVLAAIGLDVLLRIAPGRRTDLAAGRIRLAAGLAVAGCAAIVLLSLARERAALEDAGLWALTVQRSLTAMVGLALALLIVRARLRRRLGPVALVALFAGLLAADLVTLGRGFRPLVPAPLVYPPVPEIDVVRQDPGLFRVAGWGSALLPNSHVVYGLQQFRGYDSMNQRAYSELIDATLGLESALHVDRPFADGQVWDLLNVKYVFARPDVRLPDAHFERMPGLAPVYRNRRVMPRAFFVAEVRAASASDAARAIADGTVDVRRVALIDRGLPAGEMPEAGDTALDEIDVTHYRDEYVEIHTNASGRRLLVLSDLDYPGWKATVDGASVPIHRVNVAFRGVTVPAGRHVVRFAYEPMSFCVGAGLSALAALTVIGLIVWPPRRGRPGDAESRPQP